MEINEPIDQNNQSSTISSSESKQQGWASVHVVCNQGHHMKNKIIDSGSSMTLFCNNNYCNKIKTTKDPIDIHTNGGII